MRIISGESCDPRMCQTPVFFATSSGPTRTRMCRLDFIYEICRKVSKLWNLKQKLEIQNVVYEICRRSEMWNTRARVPISGDSTNPYLFRAGARFWFWFMNKYETLTNPYLQGWGENDRGVSFTFGADVVSKFLNRHDLDLICRAHQVISCPSTLLYPVSLMIEGWD